MDITYRNLFDFSNLPTPFTSHKLIQGHLQQQYIKITQKYVNISQFASVAKYFVCLIRTKKYSIKVFQEKRSKWLDTPFVLELSVGCDQSLMAASGAIAASEVIAQTNKHFLFDFRDSQNFTQKDIDMWWESSDTVRRPGMSKAALSLQSTQLYQRGILFVLLNPQPNGAGFAGVKRSLEGIDLSDHIGFELRLRGQGLNHWKVVLNHNMKDVEDKVTYEKFFNLTSIAPDFDSIKVPLNEFKPYFRGQEVDGPPIKPDRISTFGLQAYGGVYEVDKQSGPGSLEIEYIAAYY